MYHLLWELTHVVLEHPGLLSHEPDGEAERCVTYSDEGRTAEVVTITSNGRAGVILGGARLTLDVSLVEPLSVGDLVLVHAGVALARLADDDGHDDGLSERAR